MVLFLALGPVMVLHADPPGPPPDPLGGGGGGGGPVGAPIDDGGYILLFLGGVYGGYKYFRARKKIKIAIQKSVSSHTNKTK